MIGNYSALIAYFFLFKVPSSVIRFEHVFSRFPYGPMDKPVQVSIIIDIRQVDHMPIYLLSVQRDRTSLHMSKSSFPHACNHSY